MTEHATAGATRTRAYRRVPVRLRRARAFAPVVPQELGLNSYRAQWLGMLGCAFFAFAQFVETLPVLREQETLFAPWYSVFLGAVLVLAGLLAGYGARHSVRPSILLLLAGVIGLAVVALPLASTGGVLAQPPWIMDFVLVAVAAVALAWSPWAALLYLASLETVCAVIMSWLLDLDPAMDHWGTAVLTRTGIGLLVILLIVRARSAVARLDQAYTEALSQELALTRSRSETADQERMDRLIHDNVMAALLDASRSEGPVPRRTRELALRALEVLDAENDRLTGNTTTVVHVLMDELMSSLSPWRSRVRFGSLRSHIRPVGQPRAFVPGFVAQALVQAVTEAVANSARHSGTEVTYVSMEGEACRPTPGNPEGFYLRFTVRDEGRGFALHDVAAHRLGVRVSIVENVESVGGHVRLQSAPGRGTTVTVTWPGDAPL